MCRVMKLLMLALTMVVAQEHCTAGSPQEASEGRCLLAKKKVMGKVALIQEDSSVASEGLNHKHSDWRIRHMAKEKAMNDQIKKSMLDKFITAQETSSSHCSSRLMESKRILDGLLADVQTLSKQVTSQEEILSVEKENLEITETSITATKTEYKESITICKKERKEAFDELKTYSSELAELKAIADPSLRLEMSHSVKINLNEETPQKPTSADKGVDQSLLETKFDKETCLAFLDFSKRHTSHKMVQDPEKERDCDKQREELQEAFEEAVKQTRDLKEAARKRTVDETCFETAETKKTTELVPLVAQRSVAVEKIEVASQAISTLTPVLNLVKEKAEKLQLHIEETLTPECAEAGEASKVLQRVRDLIISLEECPGRNDFKLKIPPADEKKEEPDEAVVKLPEEEAPTPEPTAPTEEPTKPPEEEEAPIEEPTKPPQEEDETPNTDLENEVPNEDEMPNENEMPNEDPDDKVPNEGENNEDPDNEAPNDNEIPNEDEVENEDENSDEVSEVEVGKEVSKRPRRGKRR